MDFFFPYFTFEIKATVTSKIMIHLLSMLVKKPTKHCKFVTALLLAHTVRLICLILKFRCILDEFQHIIKPLGTV